ncbi:MAG: hypothetical protein GY777_00055 [Candidatus Brocadiaceae bacterium]|nr:hypothetical protein [Candidatus Brocadiaceae bacterium]
MLSLVIGRLDPFIYHPYGSVGTLPWINPNRADVVGFGSKPNPKQLLNLAKQIKTFAEGTDPNLSEILKIREHMKMAKRLVFLGFAFHKLNMKLISILPSEESKEIGFSGIKCFATTIGISKNDKEIVEKQINDLYTYYVNHTNIAIRMANLKCSQFFLEFWRSLAF